MEKTKLYGARVQVAEAMEQGLPWHETAKRAGLEISQSTAYRLRQRMRQGGEQALREGRHGHPVKLRGEARTFADFLAQLSIEGRTLTTILKTNQYSGLEDFLNVGPFVPLTVDRHGTVLREVAPAQFWLPRAERQDELLLLSVALIRDLRKSVLCPPSEEELPRAWWADIRHEEVAWWQ